MNFFPAIGSTIEAVVVAHPLAVVPNDPPRLSTRESDLEWASLDPVNLHGG